MIQPGAKTARRIVRQDQFSSVDVTLLHAREAGEQALQVSGRERAVGIEINPALGIDRDADIQIPTWREHSDQFRRRLLGTLRIDRITIAPEADVLDDTQGRKTG